MIQADQKQINTDFLYADLTYIVRGCIFKVYNQLGFGHKEEVYQKALELELISSKIIHVPEMSIKVKYKGIAVGNYRPDLLIEDKLIIELKAVEFMPKQYEAQILHYLKTTGYPLGLLVNFGNPKLYIKRLIWTKP